MVLMITYFITNKFFGEKTMLEDLYYPISKPRGGINKYYYNEGIIN